VSALRNPMLNPNVLLCIDLVTLQFTGERIILGDANHPAHSVIIDTYPAKLPASG